MPRRFHFVVPFRYGGGPRSPVVGLQSEPLDVLGGDVVARIGGALVEHVGRAEPVVRDVPVVEQHIAVNELREQSPLR